MSPHKPWARGGVSCYCHPPLTLGVFPVRLDVRRLEEGEDSITVHVQDYLLFFILRFFWYLIVMAKASTLYIQIVVLFKVIGRSKSGYGSNLYQSFWISSGNILISSSFIKQSSTSTGSICSTGRFWVLIMSTDYEEVAGGGSTRELSESLLCAPGWCLEDKLVYLWQSFGQTQWGKSDFLGLLLDTWLLLHFLKSKAFGYSSAGVHNLHCLLESLRNLVSHAHAQFHHKNSDTVDWEGALVLVFFFFLELSRWF